MDKKRKQPLPVSFYLGKDDRQRRVEQLDELAKRLGKTDRSKLLQAIADGEFEIHPKTVRAG